MKTVFKILIAIVILLVLIQLVPVEKNQKPVQANQDFISLQSPPKNIAKQLKNSCYDCHSNQTVYPNYAQFAPISWWIENHVKEGKEHLNFSEWSSYNQDQKAHAIRELIEEVEYNKMPMAAYVNQHPDARWSNQEKEEFINFFQDLREKLKTP